MFNMPYESNTVQNTAVNTSPAPTTKKPATLPPHPSQEPVQGKPQVKIAKINGRNKVIDFSCGTLVPALESDFAMVHGCGGKNHAPNSAITCNLCDFSKGTGDLSVSVKYLLEPFEFDYLASLALDVRKKEVFGFKGGKTVVLNKSKVNPYQKGSDGYAPCSSLSVGLNMEPGTKYPWTITVNNFFAPLCEDKEKGTITYNGKKASDNQQVFISCSASDFHRAMVAVTRYLHLWEMRFVRQIERQCQTLEGKKN